MNNIEDLKNHIEIPTEIDLAIEKGIKRGKEEKIKSKRKFKYKKVAVAGTLIVCFLGFSTMNPAFAENIPGIGKVAKYLKNSFDYNSNMEKYGDNINIVQNKNDMEISLEGVIYDEASLKFIYTITSKEKLAWGVQIRNTSLKINGKDVLKRDKDNSITDREFSITDKKIEDLKDGGEKYAVINSYDISDLKLGKDVEIDWSINEVHLHDGIFNKGPWNFKFKTSKEKLAKNTKILDLNKEFEVEGYKYTLNKIIITPVEVKIISTKPEKLSYELIDVCSEIEAKSKVKAGDILDYESDRMVKFIKGLEDTNENRELVEKYYKLNDINNKLKYYMEANITDENGEGVQGSTGRSNNGFDVMSCRPFKTMPKKIIITPRNMVEHKKWQEMILEEEYLEYSLDDLKQGAEFKQVENKSIVINSVEKNEDTLKLNISYKGIDKLGRFSSNTIGLVEVDRSIKNKCDKYDSDYIQGGELDKEWAEAQENLESVNLTYKLDKNKKYKIWIAKAYNESDYYDVDNRMEFDVK